MEYVRDRLVRETIRFMEMCQLYYFQGKIGQKDYYKLTYTKIKFIDDMVNKGKKDTFLGKSIKARINKVFYNENCIYGLGKEVVGE